MIDYNKFDNDIRDINNMFLMICYCVFWSYNELEDNKFGKWWCNYFLKRENNLVFVLILYLRWLIKFFLVIN